MGIYAVNDFIKIYGHQKSYRQNMPWLAANTPEVMVKELFWKQPFK
jgi:hypothetical protein